MENVSRARKTMMRSAALAMSIMPARARASSGATPESATSGATKDISVISCVEKGSRGLRIAVVLREDGGLVELGYDPLGGGLDALEKGTGVDADKEDHRN